MSSSADYAALQTFLADPTRPAGTLRYHELQGFLFTVACCPDLVSSTEWLPVVFADREAGYQSLEEANEILGQLMHLYNEVVRLARGETARLPGDCVIRDDALANLADDAPLAQWSRGFLHGHQWLDESWQAYISFELEEEYAAVMMALTFFASPSLAEDYAAESHSDVAKLASTVKRLFLDAAREYAHLGAAIQQVLAESDAPPAEGHRATKVGRNEPCSCGSGKKWKKCCGAVSG
jgi:uncharacterized protein